MIDTLFVARAEFIRSGRAVPVRRGSGADSRVSAVTPGVPERSAFQAVSLARQAVGYARQSDRVAAAGEAVAAALKAANAVFSALAKSRTLAASAVVGGFAPGQPAGATGTALVMPALSVLGTVSLAGDQAASASGLLTVSPVTALGSIELADDAPAGATGTQDVASVGSFVSETSISFGQTLTINAGNGVNTITFGIFPSQVRSADELAQAINAIDGVNAAYTGDGYLAISGDDADTSFTIGGTADIEGVFGIAEQAYDPVNLLVQGLGSGSTLTFQRNQDAVQTVTFGSAAGQVSTLAEFAVQLASIGGLTAALDGNNRLNFSANNHTDTVTLGGSADLTGTFGIVAKAYDPQDLLNQGIVQGDTLSFKLGNDAAQVVTFGTGAGEVHTIGELNAVLAGLSGINASIDGENRLSIVADEAREAIALGGTATGVFGLAAGPHAPVNLLSQGVGAGQTLTFQVNGDAAQTITFGTGDGEVATVGELDAALSALTGFSASLDASNRLAFSAFDAADTIALASNLDAQTVFGVAAGSHEPPGLLEQGLNQDETITFRIADGPVQTITFGTGQGEVDTVAELDGALGGLAGLSASIDAGNRLTFTALDANDTVSVGGTAAVAAVFGIDQQTYQPVAGADAPENDSVLSQIEAEFANATAALLNARTPVGPRLVEGYSLPLELSLQGAGATTFGGFDLSLDGLGVAPAGAADFATTEAAAAKIAQIDAALDKVQFAIAGLRSGERVLASQTEYAQARLALADEAKGALATAPQNLEAAQEAARLARVEQGRLVLARGLYAGLAGGRSHVDPRVADQLIQAAFGSAGGLLLAPVELTSGGTLLRTQVFA